MGEQIPQPADQTIGVNPSKTRPLVTLVLLSFNQEEYIRAAIEGALAQTYQPLEILLSDDCSSDETFKIMTDIVANYRGPHTLCLNRSEQNLGVFHHLLSVIKQSHGDLIVASAGDDISLPHRVERLVKSWQSTGAAILGSAHHEIDERGAILRSNVHLKTFIGGENLFLDKKGPEIVAFCGATACYDRAITNYLAETDLGVEYEDFIISYIANKIRRPPVHIDEPLILYRRHATALTHHPFQFQDFTEFEQRALRHYRNRLNMLKYIKVIDARLLKENNTCRATNWKYINKEIEFLETVIKWDSFTITQRMRNIFASLGNIKMAKWKVSRLFGKHPKYYPSRPIKKTLSFFRNLIQARTLATGGFSQIRY